MLKQQTSKVTPEFGAMLHLYTVISSAGSLAIVITLTCSGRVFHHITLSDPNQSWQKVTTSVTKPTTKFGYRSHAFLCLLMCYQPVRPIPKGRPPISALNDVIHLLIYARRQKFRIFFTLGGGMIEKVKFSVFGVGQVK